MRRQLPSGFAIGCAAISALVVACGSGRSLNFGGTPQQDGAATAAATAAPPSPQVDPPASRGADAAAAADAPGAQSATDVPRLAADATALPNAAAWLGFFVSSAGSGARGGNLGGIAGADALCQQLARAAGAGARSFRAYMSASAIGPAPVIHARDRIGAGPWYNHAGALIATNVAALHSDGIPPSKMSDEYGRPIPVTEHGILTGTSKEGLQVAPRSSCLDWRSASDEREAIVGFTDKDAKSWGSAGNVSCDPIDMLSQGSGGRIYCFSLEPPSALPPRDPTPPPPPPVLTPAGRDGPAASDGPCLAPLLLCNGACVDPRSDARHCGGCGASCSATVKNTEGPRCESGRCGYLRCTGERSRPTPLPDGTWNSYMDCDGDRSNGCEVQRSPTRCGCMRTCEAPAVCQWDVSDARWACE
jgi:hypothetical protein